MMATASIAVDGSRGYGPDKTEWISLIAFGKAGDELARHSKGDLIAAIGQLSRSRFTGRDGVERAGWSLAIESLLFARTVRPRGRRHNGDGSRGQRPANGSYAPMPNDRVGDLWQS